MGVSVIVLHINRSGLNHTQLYTWMPNGWRTIKSLVHADEGKEWLNPSREKK